ncbi:MAG TPA: DUF2726 domain-containing protein, partial [Anaerolineales bacterium]|nr:DUF2726 domain-containing protein [Anaerolineales bacterium]
SILPYNRVMAEDINNRLPYRLREPFLSKPEAALFRLLTELMGSRYYVCPKVALTDLFMIVRPNENVHFFNKIFRKHVDFLLCDPETFTPTFGVELIRPVSKDVVREVDRFMEDIFHDAGIPLVHIPSSEFYAPADVIALFQLAVVKAGKSASIRIEQMADTVPNCPICGKMMVLRIHRNGQEKGVKYYGCIDSPRCAGVVSIG